MGDSNVSYFLSVDAKLTDEKARFTILAGDRHLEAGHIPVKPGLFALTTNSPVGWTGELHANKGQPPGGTMLFADGHAEFLTSHRVNDAVGAQGLSTNRLAVP